MTEPKMVRASDLFTVDEIKRAIRLYRECKAEFRRFNPECRDQIVKPVLARINRVTGQTNDPSYIAYVLEYLIIERGV